VRCWPTQSGWRRNTSGVRTQQPPTRTLLTTLEAQLGKLRQGLAPLIDSDAEALIDKQEFEPLITRLRQRIAHVEAQRHQLAEQEALGPDVRLIMGRLEDFAAQVPDGLAEADWSRKREMIRALVKRVEVAHDQVKVVFRLEPRPGDSSSEKKVCKIVGGVCSPLWANLFLHYAFDLWMQRHYPHIPFERFVDDAIGHCVSEAQAQELRTALARRFADCGLELHPQKTKIVYCQDDDRRGTYPEEHFDCLGYTFRPRRSKNRWGKYCINFSPGVSNAAAKAIRHAIRQWQLRCRVDTQLDDLARMFNPIIRGWLTHYTGYYKSALYPTLQHLEWQLERRAMAKYQRLRRHRRWAEPWLRRVARRQPGLFARWRFLHAGAERSEPDEPRGSRPDL
jgi:hypothetical protein